MKKYVYIIVTGLLPLSFIACSKKDKIQTISDPPTHEEAYQLKSLIFTATDSSLGKSFVESRTPLTYTNNTTLTQSIIVDPKDILEASQFKSPELDKLNIKLEDSSIIAVPFQINGANISLGNKKWPFSVNQPVSKPSDFRETSTVKVAPGKQVRVELSIEYNKISATFEAVLQQKETGVQQTIRGVWYGSYPAKTATTVKEIK